MTKNKQQLFEEELEKLQKEFVSKEKKEESDEAIASDLIEFILQRERLRHGVVAGTPEASTLDASTLRRLATWDSDDPSMAVLEKAFRKLVVGHSVNSIRYLKRAIEQRIDAFSEEQRQKAKKPRGEHPVNALIEAHVRQNPTISTRDLYLALKRQVGHGILARVDKSEIEPVDDKSPIIQTTSLRYRLTRIKKKLAR